MAVGPRHGPGGTDLVPRRCRVAILGQGPGTPWPLNLVGRCAVPVAVGVAVLRRQLYDLDVVVGHTLVYGALTAGVVAIYAGSVGLLGDRLGHSGTLRSSVLAGAWSP